MAQLTLRLANGNRAATWNIARHPRVIADAIKAFARRHGVSPLSVHYDVH